MIISPKTAIEKGWIRGIKDLDKQVQPNGIDITLDTLKLLRDQTASLSESTKVMRALETVPVVELGVGSQFWDLLGGKVYDGTSDVYVDIPEGVAAIILPRSTLVRNGVFTVNGLYDAGYKGAIGFTMYPIAGTISIGVGTRVAQIVFMSAESAGVYAGGYNHPQGTHYTDEQQKQLDYLEASGELIGKRPQEGEILDNALKNATRGNTPGSFL